MQFPNDESKWIYLAGIIDCEGCIGLSRVKGYRKSTRYCFVPYIIISNTNKDFIDFLRKNYGGGYHGKNRNNGWGSKPIWSWKIRANLMREILPQIFPYLIIKKKQAEICIEVLQILKTNRSLIHFCYHDRLIVNFQRLENLWKECRNLTSKGPHNL